MNEDQLEEARRLWTELWEGQWQVFEITTEGGIRKLVLRRPQGRTQPVTEAERMALSMTIQGYPLKHIAMDQGVSLSTASNRLKCALRKLGLNRRLEVAQWSAIGSVAA